MGEIITHLLLPSGWKSPDDQLTKESLYWDLKKRQGPDSRRAGTRAFWAEIAVNLWGLLEARTVYVGTPLSELRRGEKGDWW